MVGSNGDTRTSNSTIYCWDCRMVLNRGSDGNLRGCGDPHCDHGSSFGDWETGHSSMVASELEESSVLDENLSEYRGGDSDVDNIIRDFWVSFKSASRALNLDGRDE